jgi:phosphatidylserine decarboxylase
MVRDGYFYGIGCAVAAVILSWLAAWPYAIPVVLIGLFCVWFFRDPERQIPSLPGAIVSPGDGKVTDVSTVSSGSGQQSRISIFLNVFDVHVNRSPIAGVIRDVRYQHGKFLNAMAANSADENEQNIVTVEGDGRIVVFKQIAGLIARRIVFGLKVGDTVARGQRVGLIKFGSRVDVTFDCDAEIQVKPGDRVKGGATVLAVLPVIHAPRFDSPASDSKDQPVAAGQEREAPAAWKN